MKVSVIITTYNHEEYIAQALGSVLMQNVNFEYEIVVGDDCSTDATGEIIEGYQIRYPDKIRYFRRTKNIGPHENFLLLLGSSEGEYIAILDGDDYWISPEKLKTQTEFLDKHSECACCGHNAKMIFEDGRESGLYNQTEIYEITGLTDIIKRNYLPSCSVMFRRGLFDELPNWYKKLSFGDWSLHIINTEHGSIGYLKEVMSVYRIHLRGSDSRGALKKDKLSNDLRFYSETRTFYKLLDKHLCYKHHDLIMREMSNRAWYLAQLYTKEKCKANALKYMMKCVIEDPFNKEICRRAFYTTLLRLFIPTVFTRTK